MSDFSELCPLFSTGVYHELTLPEVVVSGISTSLMAMHGFCFSRSVVVENAWIVKTVTSTWTASTIINLLHCTTRSITVASQTLFASYHINTTGVTTDTFTIGHACTMNMVGSTTFSSTDLLSVQVETESANFGRVAFILRYRDK